MEKVVALKNISVYRKYNKVLSDISFSVNEGEFVYLTGRVGSGKSSLLKIIYADEEIRSGEGMTAGYDLKKIKQKEIPLLRRKIGIVFQDYKLLTDRNVFDNLKFVLEASGEKSKSVIKDKIKSILLTVGLEGKENRIPFELSGGEQQSVGIARALINNPSLILADEPTGNLDEKSSDNIIHLLIDASKHNTAVIMATHDMNLIKKFPAKVFNLEENKFENQY
ncbi:MAG: ATP-binding cassette domain-containing protein [Chlorobi bacterium]|nr:ATP-binding cassette domain-containing protein [Chlorobiota bacterium]